MHFDPNKPLIVECDALQHGLGSVAVFLLLVISHDGLPKDVIHLMDFLSTTTISCANIQKWEQQGPSFIRTCFAQCFPSTELDNSLHTSPELWN